MSERQETVHVVQREDLRTGKVKAGKVYDDRADARAYAKRMNATTLHFHYTVQSCKKG